MGVLGLCSDPDSGGAAAVALQTWALVEDADPLRVELVKRGSGRLELRARVRGDIDRWMPVAVAREDDRGRWSVRALVAGHEQTAADFAAARQCLIEDLHELLPGRLIQEST
jgi:hypothetical protein